MVDNLGGILSEGTLAQKRAYYEQIAHQCAQINNDNVLTLQKINDAALSTLLLRKLARCQELHLPIYLHASGPLCFNKALSPALCQAMGVLLDNAIEAAADSLYPRIIVHMDCKEKHTEIHVVNTFPATMDVDDFLRGNTISTKAGHAGGRSAEHCCIVPEIYQFQRTVYIAGAVYPMHPDDPVTKEPLIHGPDCERAPCGALDNASGWYEPVWCLLCQSRGEARLEGWTIVRRYYLSFGAGRSSLPGGWLFRFCLSDVFCAYVIAGSFCLPPAWAVPSGLPQVSACLRSSASYLWLGPFAYGYLARSVPMP